MSFKLAGDCGGHASVEASTKRLPCTLSLVLLDFASRQAFPLKELDLDSGGYWLLLHSLSLARDPLKVFKDPFINAKGGLLYPEMNHKAAVVLIHRGCLQTLPSWFYPFSSPPPPMCPSTPPEHLVLSSLNTSVSIAMGKNSAPEILVPNGYSGSDLKQVQF